MGADAFRQVQGLAGGGAGVLDLALGILGVGLAGEVQGMGAYASRVEQGVGLGEHRLCRSRLVHVTVAGGASTQDLGSVEPVGPVWVLVVVRLSQECFCAVEVGPAAGVAQVGAGASAPGGEHGFGPGGGPAANGGKPGVGHGFRVAQPTRVVCGDAPEGEGVGPQGVVSGDAGGAQSCVEGTVGAFASDVEQGGGPLAGEVGGGGVQPGAVRVAVRAAPQQPGDQGQGAGGFSQDRSAAVLVVHAPQHLSSGLDSGHRCFPDALPAGELAGCGGVGGHPGQQ